MFESPSRNLLLSISWMQKTAQWRSDTRLKLIRLAEMIQAAQRAFLRCSCDLYHRRDKAKVCVARKEKGQLLSG
jgi:hypothetical protein